MATDRFTVEDFRRRLVALGISDTDRLAEIARATIRHVTGAKSSRMATKDGQALERAWYDSLAAGSPDYSVYGADAYLAESFACWVVYSRQYLKAIESHRFPSGGLDADLGGIRSIVDLGCGIGYTTATLRVNYPTAIVRGTNLPGTTQWRFAETLSDEYVFGLSENVEQEADVVFASEYFEHIEAPVAHLRTVVATAKPKALIVANSFSAKAIGHFDNYDVDGAKLDGRKTARAFSSELRSLGYQKVETQLWNSRPTYWRRA